MPNIVKAHDGSIVNLDNVFHINIESLTSDAEFAVVAKSVITCVDPHGNLYWDEAKLQIGTKAECEAYIDWLGSQCNLLEFPG